MIMSETIIPAAIGAISGVALYYIILKPAFLYWLNKWKD